MSTTTPRTKKRYPVARLKDFPSGESREVDVRGRSIAVFHDNGKFYAIRNVCPHHGAPLCAGRVQGRMVPSAPHTYDYSGDEEGERVVLCPWHGYKFRITDGRSPTDPKRLAVRTYDVSVEDDEVIVYA